MPKESQRQWVQLVCVRSADMGFVGTKDEVWKRCMLSLLYW